MLNTERVSSTQTTETCNRINALDSENTFDDCQLKKKKKEKKMAKVDMKMRT